MKTNQAIVYENKTKASYFEEYLGMSYSLKPEKGYKVHQKSPIPYLLHVIYT